MGTANTRSKSRARRLSPYQIALHEALIRNLTGLGEQIARVVRMKGYALEAVEGGKPILESILAGVEEIAQDIVAGKTPETVRVILARSTPDTDEPSLNDCLERLLTRIGIAFQEANADKAAGSRWPKTLEERLTIDDLLRELDDAFVPAECYGTLQDDPEALRALLEFELWRRINRAVYEASRVPTRHPREHLARVPHETRRLAKMQLDVIAATTTGDHFVDLAPHERRLVPQAQ